MTLATTVEEPKPYKLRVNGKVIAKPTELRERVPVSAIKRDPDYQRDVSEAWVAAHMPFDEKQATAVVLSDRAGGPWLVDGGHRHALAKASNFEFIKAFVIHGLTKMEEAALFVAFQRDRRNLTAFALYRAELVAGNPETLAMLTIVERAGFLIENRVHGPRSITAIDSIRYVYRLGGEVLLAETLQAVRDSGWFGMDRATSGPCLKGIAIFLEAEQKEAVFDRDRLLRTLRHHGPGQLLLKSQDVAIARRAASTSASNVAEALLIFYNTGLSAVRKLPTLKINNRTRPKRRSAAA